MFIIDKLISLIPAEYKWEIAIKKASYTVGKLATAALMMGWVGKHVGAHLTPEQLQQVQGLAGALTAAALEGLHDYLKVRYADSPIRKYL